MNFSSHLASCKYCPCDSFGDDLLANIAPSSYFGLMLIICNLEPHSYLIHHYSQEIKSRVLLCGLFFEVGATLMGIQTVVQLGCG